MDDDKRYPTWYLSSIKMSSSWLYHTEFVMLHYCDWLEKEGGNYDSGGVGNGDGGGERRREC